MNILVIRYSPYWTESLLESSETLYLIVESRGGGATSIPAEVIPRFARIYMISSFDSIEELSAVAADLIVAGIKIDRIASATEHTQYATGYLAEVLSMRHTSASAVLASRDKRLMKYKVRKAGVATAHWASLPATIAKSDLDAVTRQVGFPMIIKPANGFGAFSTLKVTSGPDFEAALNDFSFSQEMHSRHLIIEEFIDGDEYHVDAIWRDGEPWLFAISRYLANRLDVSTSNEKMDGSVVLAEAEHADLYDRVRDLHQKVNEALGILSGPTHLEVFVEHETGRLVFSEIATRLGGGLISKVLALAWGVDARVAVAHEINGGSLADLACHRSAGHAGFLI